MTDPTIDVARGLPRAIPPISLSDARHRIVAFCTAPHSGWITYDLAAVHARSAGAFASVSPWAMLWADALAGRVTVGNVADFTRERRVQFADLVSAVPSTEELRTMNQEGRSAVARLCCFGYPGVWGPKVTKVAALYRPRAVPVLDGYVAMAFGFDREGFSAGSAPRHARIGRVIDLLADWLAANGEIVDDLRRSVRVTVPEVDLISDLRLLDIVLWTSQDDRLSRPRKAADAWLNWGPGRRTPLEEVAAVPVGNEGAPE